MTFGKHVTAFGRGNTVLPHFQTCKNPLHSHSGSETRRNSAAAERATGLHDSKRCFPNHVRRLLPPRGHSRTLRRTSTTVGCTPVLCEQIPNAVFASRTLRVEINVWLLQIHRDIARNFKMGQVLRHIKGTRYRLVIWRCYFRGTA